MIAYIIHLSRAEHRRANVKKIQSDLAASDLTSSNLASVETRILTAVEGKTLDEDEKRAFSARAIHRPAYPFPLNAGEIACFLSHRLAWQALIDSGHDQGLIFEDDADVDVDKLRDDLRRIKAANPEFVQLQSRPPAPRQSGLVRARPVPLRMTGQWLTAAAAEKLLAASPAFDRPVDTWLQMTWLHGVDVRSLYPSAVREGAPSVAATTIQQAKKKNLIAEVGKSVRRSLYRQHISRLSK